MANTLGGTDNIVVLAPAVVDALRSYDAEFGGTTIWVEGEREQQQSEEDPFGELDI